MINFFTKNYKSFIIWMLFTFLLYIALATAMMFTRIITLHGVRIIDFDIIHKAVSLLDNKNLNHDFKTITKPLTMKNGQVIFFPVAILSKNNCIENGSRTDKICSKFPNIDTFRQTVKKVGSRDYYKTVIYDLNKGESYLYKDLNDHSALIGQAGEYKHIKKSIGTNLKEFFIFIRDEWCGYFLNLCKEPGKYGHSINKTWEKTSGIFFITFTISIILYFILLWYQRTKEREYAKLKEESSKTDVILYDLNNEFNSLRQQQQGIENEISELSRDRGVLSELSDEYKQKLDEYEKQEEDLKKLISAKKQEIISEEHKDDSLIDNIRKKSDTITRKEMAKELELLIDKLHDVKKLWQREYSWDKRKELESRVTGYDHKIPFTISQAVILFEKEVVLKMAKTCPGYDESMNLLKMIQLISKCKNLSDDITDKLHKIRKARNKWSHDGTPPSADVIDDLLTLLNTFGIEPSF